MNTPRLVLSIKLLFLLTLGALWQASVVDAAPITWGTPVYVSDPTDVSTNGTAVYAYCFSGLNKTINGVNFTGTTATGNIGPDLTLAGDAGTIGNNATTFGSPTANPWGLVDPDYQDILRGADFANLISADPWTVTLNNLEVGRSYEVQLWCLDARSVPGRTCTVSNAIAGGNSVVVDYNSTETTGGVGQYTIGTFVADGTTQTFRMKGSDSTQLNAIQLRKAAGVYGLWTGAVDGNWDNATTNFSDGLSFVATTNITGTIVFTDDDGLGNPVVNTNITIQASGVSPVAVKFLNNSLQYSFQNAGAAGISGSTTVNKDGTGRVTFSGAQTYTGNTTVTAGTLALGAGGSIANSPVITLAAGATLDTSAAGSISLGSGQLLTGNGAVKGNVNAATGSLISPGTTGTIGTLTFSNNLTLDFSGGTQTFDANLAANDKLNVVGILTNNSTMMIALNQLVPISAGNYTLITYASKVGAGTFTLASGLPSGSFLTVGANSVVLTVAAANLTWAGDGSANIWNIQGAMNWLSGASPSLFYQGDLVTFNDSGSASPAINLTGSLVPFSVVVNSSQDYTFGGSGKISGLANLTKQGTGTLILDEAGTNDYTGGTTISAGVLQLGNNDANGSLGSGAITNNATLVSKGSGTNTVAGAISGSGVVVQSGSGRTILANSGSYLGGTIITNGTLQLNAVNSAGTGAIAISNATLALRSVATYAYSISGTGTIETVGTGPAGFLQFSSTLANFSGNFTVGVNGVGRFVNRSANSGLGAGITVIVTNGGQMYCQSAATVAGSVYVSGEGDGDGLGALRLEANSPFALMGPVTFTGDTVIFAGNASGITGAIGDGGNGYGFTKIGGAVLTLSATNTYSGDTTISNGTVALGATGSIANSPNIILGGGTFNVTALGGLSLASGQTLRGNGNVSGAITVPVGSQIIPGGTGIPGTLNFNNGLTLNGQGLTFDLSATPTIVTSNDLITVAGSALTLNGNTVITLNYSALAPGLYSLLTYPSLAGGGTFTLASAYPGVTLYVEGSATYIKVGTELTWQGDGSANNWDLSTANWLNGASPAAFAQTNNVTFTDSGSNTPDINVNGDRLVGSMIMDASQNYTFSGSGALSFGPLYLNGIGTVTLLNTNIFAVTSIGSGTLQVGNGGSSGAIVGPIVNQSQLVLNHSGTRTNSNAISGVGSLTVNGSGLEVMTGTSTYSGGTTVNTGTLQLNNIAAAGAGPIHVNSVVNVLASNQRFPGINAFDGSGVINVLAAGSGNNDQVQFDCSLEVPLTINIPVGSSSAARLITTASNGVASSLTINVTNGGQLYVQSVPVSPPELGASVRLCGFGAGNSQQYGAMRLDNTLSGDVTLTGNAGIGSANGAGRIINDIDDNGNGFGLTIMTNKITFNGMLGLHSGNTRIRTNATLAFENTSATPNSPAIQIDSLGTLDVTNNALATYPIPVGGIYAATQMLEGTGQNGKIVGNVTLGAGGSLGVKITTNGQPSLLVGSGTLAISNNPVTVTTVTPLPAGTYPLVGNNAGGSVTGIISSSTLTIAGAGLAGGATGSLSISNSVLYLNVAAPAQPAVISSGAYLPGNAGFQLIFTGTTGDDYSVLASTNLVLPLISWDVIATGTFSGIAVTNIDTAATNYLLRFYRIQTQ